MRVKERAGKGKKVIKTEKEKEREQKNVNFALLLTSCVIYRWCSVVLNVFKIKIKIKQSPQLPLVSAFVLYCLFSNIVSEIFILKYKSIIWAAIYLLCKIKKFVLKRAKNKSFDLNSYLIHFDRFWESLKEEEKNRATHIQKYTSTIYSHTHSQMKTNYEKCSK